MKSTGAKLNNKTGRAKAVRLVMFLLLASFALMMPACGEDMASDEQETAAETTQSSDSGNGQNSGYASLSSTEDIGLYDRDGGGVNYAFTYRGETFYAQYLPDNWTIYDSYKIKRKHDMIIICQALIDTHTVHGSDMVSYRTAEDMAYEWRQHNLACRILSEDNEWRSSAENVDFDPEDQGKSLKELFEDRTGNE